MTDPPREAPLDLRLGDLRRIVSPEELFTPLPDELDEVTVWGHTETPDMVETRPVPGGLAGIAWAMWHPSKLWRLFVPDPNLEILDEDLDGR